MKKRKTAFTFFLTLILLMTFITCENPVMEKWWGDDDVKTPTTNSGAPFQIGNTYTVKFETNGGDPAPDDQRIAEGSMLSKVLPMAKNTEGFGGWYIDNTTFQYRWNFDTFTIEAPDVDNDGVLTLYAKWAPDAPNVFTVTFDSNNATYFKYEIEPIPLRTQIVLNDDSIEGDGLLIEPTPGTKGDDYGFAGWYDSVIDGNGTGNRWDFTKPVPGNMTLYARWEPTNRTIVTFDSNDGSPVPEPQILAGDANNKKIREPEAMTRVGYGFGGWYENEACTGDPWDFSNRTVSGELVTLYAKWVTNLYTVKFVSNIGSPVPEAREIPYGSKIDEPSPMTQTGMGFGGWFKGTDFSQQWNFLTDTVTEDMTLYAKWGEGQYKVIFHLDNGSQNLEQLVVHGAKVTRPPDPTKAPDPNGKDGYVFKGWYTTNITTDKTLFDFDNPLTEPTAPAPGTSGNPAIINIYARYVFHNPMMAWIPGGTFSMGGLGGAGAATRPAHNVTVSGFYMFRAEITQYAFHSVHWWKKYGTLSNTYSFDATTIVGTQSWAFNPSRAKGMYRPVESITWYDAVYFCNLVTEYENKVSRKGIDPFELPYKITAIQHENGATGVSQTVPAGKEWFEIAEKANYSMNIGTEVNESITYALVELNPKLNPNDPNYAPEKVGYRLPTEAEWEYAARGGNGSPGDYKWAGSNTANDVAWYGGGGGNTTQTQAWGQKTPNQFGIYDMSGNVCEWCWDWYDKDYYTDTTATNPPGVDPIGPTDTEASANSLTQRTRRGGSIRHSPDNCRTQVRDSWEPGKTDNWNIGFRLVRTGEE